MDRAKILAKLIDEREDSKSAFAKKVGIPATTLQSMLSRGVGNSSVDNVIKVCKGLGITTEDLERMANEPNWHKDIIPLRIKKVPLLVDISDGEPILALEEYKTYVEIDNTISVDFCLKAKGDIMIDARINDGDIVFVKKQPSVENGDIAVILIDNEATLRRFYKNDGGVILKPENSKSQPKYYNDKDFKDIRILGKAILFQSEVS